MRTYCTERRGRWLRAAPRASSRSVTPFGARGLPWVGARGLPWVGVAGLLLGARGLPWVGVAGLLLGARGLPWVGVAGLLVSLAGCGDGSDAATRGPLVIAGLWSTAAADRDPFRALVSDETVACGPQDWRAELSGVEVTTVGCNYVTLQQALPQPIAAGQLVRLEAWWQTLASVEPAEGHIAVWIGDWPVLEERVAIPSDADARSIEQPAPAAIAEGTPIFFHVDNHGFNSWTLGSLIAE